MSRWYGMNREQHRGAGMMVGRNIREEIWSRSSSDTKEVLKRIKEKGEFRLSHWTSFGSGLNILKEWMEGCQERKGRIKLQLNAGLGMNDPKEAARRIQRTVKSKRGNVVVAPMGAMMMSWTASKVKESEDRLTFWTRYGDNGRGICLTCRWSSEKLWEKRIGVVKIDYGETAKQATIGALQELDRIKVEFEQDGDWKGAWEIEELWGMLERSYKAEDWKEEEEIRLVHVATDLEVATGGLRIWTSEGKARVGIDRFVKRRCLASIDQITLGPRSDPGKGNKELIDWLLTRMSESGDKVHRSSLELG